MIPLHFLYLCEIICKINNLKIIYSLNLLEQCHSGNRDHYLSENITAPLALLVKTDRQIDLPDLQV